MATVLGRFLRFICACVAAAALAGCMGSDSGDVIADGVTVAYLTANGQPTQLARLSVPFQQDLDGEVWLNVAIDLNGDGKWAAYPVAGGAVQPEWVVDNLPVFVKAGQSQRFNIDFLDPTALSRSNLSMRVMVTSAPVDSLPVNGWDAGMATLATRDFQIGAIRTLDRVFPPNPFGTVGAGAQTVLREDVPDRKQPKDTNECVPISTANSLRWLAKKDPAGFSGLPSDDEVIKQLKADLSFDEAKKGVDPANILEGKKNFIKRNGLPVDSHQIGAKDDPAIFDKIMDELKKGQDVEIVIKWDITNPQNVIETQRHMVTVVGATVRTDGGLRLHVQDPKEEPGVDNLKIDVHPKTKSQWITNWDPFGGFIEYAFADSPRTSTTTTPSTPGTTTSTTPSTPGTTTSTTPSTTGTTTTTTPPPAPAALKVTGTTSYNVTHTRGQTACPTPIGSVALQNTGGSAMSVSVGGGVPWLDLSGSSFSVAAGGSASLSFQFNCTNYVVGSQSTTLSIQANDSASGASAGQGSVAISLTVQ